MQTFLQWLDERQLILGGKYSNNGNALILAGGAGSGKGFVLGNVLGISGRTFDVDEVKEKLVKAARNEKHDYIRNYSKQFKEMFGYDLATYNSKIPQHVADMHEFAETLGIPDSIKANFIKSMQQRGNSGRLDNVIFDVTLKNTKKLVEIGKLLDDMGYELKNRHIVWVVTPTSEAIENNLSRDRQVPENILLQTHTGVAKAMKEIIENPMYRDYADGDIWLVFNSKNLKDTVLSSDKRILEKYTKVRVKAAGKPARSLADIGKEYLEKIRAYTNSDAWQ